MVCYADPPVPKIFSSGRHVCSASGAVGAALFLLVQEYEGYVKRHETRHPTDAPSRTGNPFDLKWALSTLVHDGDIYYDYARQEWNIQAAILKASLERNSEDFAARFV